MNKKMAGDGILTSMGGGVDGIIPFVVVIGINLFIIIAATLSTIVGMKCMRQSIRWKNSVDLATEDPQDASVMLDVLQEEEDDFDDDDDGGGL